MQVKLNDVEILNFNETQEGIFKYLWPSAYMIQIATEKLQWVLNNNYEDILTTMRLHWGPILESRSLTVPENNIEFAELVFAQPDYEDRDARDAGEGA